jgi:acylphosphatase
MHRVRLLIRGHVQGVGFRYFVVHEARALGLGGEVRNRSDGAVEVEAEGDASRLRELVDAVRRGPPGARVSRVEEEWSEEPTLHRDFRITHEES